MLGAEAWVVLLFQMAALPPATLPTPVAPSPAAPPASVEREPHGGFRRWGNDFRHLADRGNLAVLGLGGAAALAVHPHDRAWTDDLHDSATLGRFFAAGETGGGGYVQEGAAIGTYVVGRLAGSAELRSLGSDLIHAQIVSGVLTVGLKRATQRLRPDGSNRSSFPSGHSSSTFATAAVLERHYGWKAGLPAYAFAAYVAGSRLQANKHFSSDVAFGAAIGIASGRSVTFDRGRVAVAPLAAPGGGWGVAIAVVGR